MIATTLKPTVGMGCTVSVGSDSNAATIIAVFELKKGGYGVKVQYDHATPAEGHDYYGVQKYTYKPNPKGRTQMFRQDGSEWRESEFSKKTDRLVWCKQSSYRLSVGERRSHSDPSF